MRNAGFRNYDPRTARRASVTGGAGFTLIEIMVVVVIIGILAALAAPKIMGRPDEARIVAARQDVAAISQALKLYKLDNLAYPTAAQGLQALVTQPTTAPLPRNWKEGGYLDFLPKDPWGNDYVYARPGKRAEIDIFSLGPDGQPGTAEFSDDVWLGGN